MLIKKDLILDKIATTVKENTGCSSHKKNIKLLHKKKYIRKSCLIRQITTSAVIMAYKNTIAMTA
jgi:hypothetical protein